MAKSTLSSTTKLLDNFIMLVFEENENFSFPITSQRDARAFVKALSGKGFSLHDLRDEIGEAEQTFTAWRKGLGRKGIGNMVMERINRPFQQLLIGDGNENDTHIYDKNLRLNIQTETTINGSSENGLMSPKSPKPKLPEKPRRLSSNNVESQFAFEKNKNPEIQDKMKIQQESIDKGNDLLNDKTSIEQNRDTTKKAETLHKEPNTLNKITLFEQQSYNKIKAQDDKELQKQPTDEAVNSEVANISMKDRVNLFEQQSPTKKKLNKDDGKKQHLDFESPQGKETEVILSTKNKVQMFEQLSTKKANNSKESSPHSDGKETNGHEVKVDSQIEKSQLVPNYEIKIKEVKESEDIKTNSEKQNYDAKSQNYDAKLRQARESEEEKSFSEKQNYDMEIKNSKESKENKSHAEKQLPEDLSKTIDSKLNESAKNQVEETKTNDKQLKFNTRANNQAEETKTDEKELVGESLLHAVKENFEILSEESSTEDSLDKELSHFVKGIIGNALQTIETEKFIETVDKSDDKTVILNISELNFVAPENIASELEHKESEEINGGKEVNVTTVVNKVEASAFNVKVSPTETEKLISVDSEKSIDKETEKPINKDTEKLINKEISQSILNETIIEQKISRSECLNTNNEDKKEIVNSAPTNTEKSSKDFNELPSLEKIDFVSEPEMQSTVHVETLDSPISITETDLSGEYKVNGKSFDDHFHETTETSEDEVLHGDCLKKYKKKKRKSVTWAEPEVASVTKVERETSEMTEDDLAIELGIPKGNAPIADIGELDNDIDLDLMDENFEGGDEGFVLLPTNTSINVDELKEMGKTAPRAVEVDFSSDEEVTEAVSNLKRPKKKNPNLSAKVAVPAFAGGEIDFMDDSDEDGPASPNVTADDGDIWVTENYDSDQDDALSPELRSAVIAARDSKNTQHDSPGFIYIFADVRPGSEVKHIKVGASRFPRRRLVQGRHFNMWLTMVKSIPVTRRKLALQHVWEKLENYAVGDHEGWYEGVMSNLVNKVTKVAITYS